MMLIVDVEDACIFEVFIEEKMSVESLATLIMNFTDDGIEAYEDIMHVLQGMESKRFTLKKLDLDLQNWPNLPNHPLRSPLQGSSRSCHNT